MQQSTAGVINNNLENTITDFFNYDLAKNLYSENKTYDIILGLIIFTYPQ